MSTTRRTLALQATACFATLWLAGPSSLAAQEAYPSRTITIVVPYTSGGGVDSVARILAQDLQASLGQPVIVDNVPGASGMIGAQRVARADPDGYNLLLSAAGEIAVNPHLKKMSYDPQRDLAPISLVVRVPNVLAVGSDRPYQSLDDFIAAAKAEPTMGVVELLDGIDTVVVAVGLFAIGETLYAAARFKFEKEEIYSLAGSVWMSASDWARSWKPWLRGTLLGFPIGALPAGGSEIPTFLSYLVEKRLAKNPDEFGKGAIEAVAGPEAANNAAAAGVLAPLLRSACRPRPPPPSCWPPFSNMACNPGHYCSTAILSWCGA